MRKPIPKSVRKQVYAKYNGIALIVAVKYRRKAST